MSRAIPVITGVGLVTCHGLDLASTWRAIIAGRDGFGPMTSMESALPPGSDGAEAPPLEAMYHPDLPREARYLRYTIEQAIADAGGVACQPHRAAVMLGTTLHGIRAGGRFLRSGDPAALGSFLAGDTLRRATDGLGLAGPMATTCSACSSSLGSVALAATMLEAGDADVVIAGGYDTISEYVWGGFNALRLVASGPPMPFCVDRPGMKLGEGYGIVVLERADDAKRRGANILATVSGWGESSDAHHLTRPHPDGEGAARAMLTAMERADVVSEDLGLVVAHATGTPDNDAAEFAALRQTLGDALSATPVVAFKSHLGHTLGGAGAVELILAATALRDGVLPATARVEPAHVEFPGLRLTTGRAERVDALRHTLNTSLGFGGSNASVVLSRPDARPTPRPMTTHEVAITGVGVVLPGAIGNAAFLQSLHHDRGPDTFGTDDLSNLLDSRKTRRMSQYVKLNLAAASLTFEQAGLLDDADRLRDTGAILGTTHGSPGYCYEYYEAIVNGGVAAANPMLFAEGVPNAAAAQLSLMYHLGASCQVIIGTRTSGLDALRLAAARIQVGHAQRLLVGAAEERHPSLDQAYEACGLQGNGGFTPSTGGVYLLLERVAAAKQRGVAPLATVGATAAFNGGPRRLERALGRVVQNVSAPVVVTSANHTRIDAIEAAALPDNARRVSLHDRFGELFSAGPLLAVAAAALGGGRWPGPLEFDGQADDAETAKPGVAVFCTDWSGQVAGCVVRPPGKYE